MESYMSCRTAAPEPTPQLWAHENSWASTEYLLIVNSSVGPMTTASKTEDVYCHFSRLYAKVDQVMTLGFQLDKDACRKKQHNATGSGGPQQNQLTQTLPQETLIAKSTSFRKVRVQRPSIMHADGKDTVSRKSATDGFGEKPQRQSRSRSLEKPCNPSKGRKELSKEIFVMTRYPHLVLSGQKWTWLYTCQNANKVLN